MPDEQNLLTDLQRQAVKAMASSGMPLRSIADALCIPIDYLEGHSSEWRVGRIESIRIGELEAGLLFEKKEYKGPAKKRAFLAAVEANGGNKTAAAALVGFGVRLHYRWLKEDPEYKTEFDLAMDRAADTLEDEVVRRAKGGVLQPIHNKNGDLIGHKLQFSDQLLLALLAAKRPEKWKSRVSAELTGKDGGPIETKSALPEWLLEQLKSNSPQGGSTTPSPAS